MKIIYKNLHFGGFHGTVFPRCPATRYYVLLVFLHIHLCQMRFSRRQLGLDVGSRIPMNHGVKNKTAYWL